MADDTGPSGDAGQDPSATTLANFHRAMDRRTKERDEARSEAARLRTQIAELSTLAPTDDESDEQPDSGADAAGQDDASQRFSPWGGFPTSEAHEPPTPRSPSAPREFRNGQPEGSLAEMAQAQRRSSGGWPT